MKHQDLYQSIIKSINNQSQEKSYRELAQSFVSVVLGGVGLFGTGSFIAMRAIQAFLLDSMLNVWFY